jgi:hypothetical protein
VFLRFSSLEKMQKGEKKPPGNWCRAAYEVFGWGQATRFFIFKTLPVLRPSR